MKKNLVGSIGQTLSIPAEALENVPYIEIRGKDSVSIENHRGIEEYTNERICIRVKNGQISVEGCDLCIERMDHHRIEISGCADRVELR